MDTHPWLQHLAERAAFSPATLTKIDCFRSDRLLVGLNCFEPGQGQPVHAHAGADKFYLVVSGKARFVVGDAASDAGPGDLILAPAGIAHGVERALERAVVLVAMAPAPAPRPAA
jgi:quercetin dioxygenase-like cupin family protein